MRRKLLKALLPLSITALVLAGCGSQTDTSPEPVEQTVESGTSVENTEVSGVDSKDKEDKQDAETGDQNAETDDRNAETGDQNAETGDQNAETGDRNAETGDQNAETGDHNAETDNQNTVNVKQDKNYTAEDVANSIDPKNFGISMQSEGFTIKITTTEKDMYMGYSYFLPADALATLMANSPDAEASFDMDQVNADGGVNMVVDIYAVDGVTYCYSNLTGADSYLKMASDESTEDSLFSDTSTTDDMMITEDEISSVEYIETVEYNGITVDAVKVTNNDSDILTIYINPKDGKAVAMAVSDSDTGSWSEPVMVDINHDGINLPAEFADAKEATVNDIVGNMMGVMFLPMYSAGDSEINFD